MPIAAKPLFRDPIFDGAADPILVFNRARDRWWMFYTNRRANRPELRGVAYCHGCEIGIAESADGGATWEYVGVCDMGGYGEIGADSFWAPDIVFDNGTYHMFVSFVEGMREEWGGPHNILHFTSEDLQQWKFETRLPLEPDRAIDATVFRLPNGNWKLWYKNEADASTVYAAESNDLFTWMPLGRANAEKECEGAKVFRWKGSYWMITDVWDGLDVYRSDDLKRWAKQDERILREHGSGADDEAIGNHADVVVAGDRAFIFYFTHPERHGERLHVDDVGTRRTSIQVAELELRNGQIFCDRNQPVEIDLGKP